jgi:hypothetical protein
MKDTMKIDRYQTMVAAFELSELEVGAAFLDHRQRLSNLIHTGSVLAIDETILASNSKEAKRCGMMRWLPGKPHPKGYFINMGVQKLRLSKLPLILDAECKFNFQSLSMEHALLAIVSRLEGQFGRSFLVLADSGFPASKLIGRPIKGLGSKFICSVSTSYLSGSLRYLSEAMTKCTPLHRKALLFNQERGLAAFGHHEKTYTQVLVTNACRVADVTPPVCYPYPMSFDQAAALAVNFSVEEMVRSLDFPAPSPWESVGYERYPSKYLLKLTGQDICSPLNVDGFVSEESLRPLSLDAIRGIADYCKIKHLGRKRSDLIKDILQRHPKAKPPEVPSGPEARKRHLQLNVATNKSAEHLEIDGNRITEQLFAETEEPDFVKIYRQNYGLEDRFNSKLYAYFDQSRCRNAHSKYTWLYFYICLWNSWALLKEKMHPDQAVAQNRNAEYHDIYSFSHFLLDVILQIRHEFS